MLSTQIIIDFTPSIPPPPPLPEDSESDASPQRRVYQFIHCAEEKGLSKNQIISYLKSKNVSLDDIICGYKILYQTKGLHEVIFDPCPSGFQISPCHNGHDAIVSAITMDQNRAAELGIQVGSIIYEIDGTRMKGTDVGYAEIVRRLQKSPQTIADSFTVVFMDPPNERTQMLREPTKD